MERITLENFSGLSRTSKLKLRIKYYDPITETERVFVRFPKLETPEIREEGGGKTKKKKKSFFILMDILEIQEDFQLKIKTVPR